VLFFALRDIRVLYKQATLGVIWVLLQPIFTVAVFTLVFSRLAGVGSDGIPYPLFALVGAVTWTYFSTATSRASVVLVANPELVTKVSFPRMAAPASAMLPPLVDVAVTTVLVVPLFVYYDTAPSWRILAAPVWLGLLVGTTFGISLWLSALNVRYRDIQAALGPALQIWLFASPVAYSTSQLDDWQELAYALNPVAGLIGLGRWSVLDAPWPGWSLAVSLTVSALILVTGLRHFRRSERVFADVI
jgi:ABC-2 type transport system permease protein/lipopolysaccharide transport system permease protein